MLCSLTCMGMVYHAGSWVSIHCLAHDAPPPCQPSRGRDSHPAVCMCSAGRFRADAISDGLMCMGVHARACRGGRARPAAPACVRKMCPKKTNLYSKQHGRVTKAGLHACMFCWLQMHQQLGHHKACRQTQQGVLKRPGHWQHAGLTLHPAISGQWRALEYSLDLTS